MIRTKREQKAGLSVGAVIASVSATARETAMAIEDFLIVPRIEASPEEEEQMAALVQKAGSVDRAFLTMLRFADYAALSLRASDAKIAELKKGSDALEGEDYEKLDEWDTGPGIDRIMERELARAGGDVMTALCRMIRRNKMMDAELKRTRSLTPYNTEIPHTNLPTTNDIDSQQRRA
jgi:hypothetical protein